MAQFQHRDFTDFLPTVRFPRLLPAAWRPRRLPTPDLQRLPRHAFGTQDRGD